MPRSKLSIVRSSRLAWWLVRAIPLGVAFALADWVSSLTTQAGSPVAGIWFPGGIALAGLVIGGIELWPALLVGGSITSPIWNGFSATSIPIVATNVAAAVIIALLLRRFRVRPTLDRLVDVLGLAGATVIGAVPMNAIALFLLGVTGKLPDDRLDATVALWILSSVTGYIVVGGALLVLYANRHARPRPWEWVEAVLLLGVLVAVSIAVFPHGIGALEIVLFAVAALTAGRLGPPGAAIASLVLFGFAADPVLSGGGPFGGSTVMQRSLSYQVAVLTLAVGIQAIGALGSGSPDAAPSVPGRIVAFMLLSVGGILLGLGQAVVAITLISEIDPPQIALVAMCIALIVLMGVIAGTGPRVHVRALRTAGRAWWIGAVLTGVALVASEELYLNAASRIEVTSAVALASLAPVVLLIIGVVLARTVPPAGVLISSFLAAVGVVALLVGGEHARGFDQAAVFMALGAAVCVAVVLIGLSFCRARTSPAPIMALVFTVSTAGALVLCLVTAQLPGVSVFTDETLVGGFFYLGIAGILLPALVSTWAIPVLGAQRTAMFEVIAPIVAIIAAKVWLGTNVASLEYVGIAVIVGSVVLSVRLHRPEHRHHHAVFRGHREPGDAGHPSREAGEAAARNG